MDFPVYSADDPERMIWVDTVSIPDDEHRIQTFAVCVCKDGSVAEVCIEDVRVCEDAKPRILLDPDKLKAALAERLGGMAGAPAAGMKLGNLTREKISPEQAQQMFGPKLPNGKEKEN